MIKDIDTAFNAAQNVINLARYQGNEFIKLEAIINAVKKIGEFKSIEVKFESFNLLGLTDASAMLYTKGNIDNLDVEIVINSDNSSKKQRFALTHELGHLLMGFAELNYQVPNNGKFTVSTLVNPDITKLSDDECNKDIFAHVEQLANIFATLVLVPKKISIAYLTNNNLDDLMSRYGVSAETIYSKLILDTI